MCEIEHGGSADEVDLVELFDDDHGALSRRRFLGMAGGAIAGSLLLPFIPSFDAPAAAADAPRPLSMALHLHGPFSEGRASIETHLEQAARNGIDVVWLTEHDWRMKAHEYRDAVHFDAMSELEDGRAWTWVAKSSGALATASGGIATDQAYAGDPRPPGSLRVAATGSTTAKAWYGYVVDTGRARMNLRTSIAGQSIDVAVLPGQIGPRAYLELRVVTSRRVLGDGSVAQFKLIYRLGGRDAPGTRRTNGTSGIVTLPAAAGQWRDHHLDLGADFAALWPSVDARDASFYDLYLVAVSEQRTPCLGWFDFLRFGRTITGSEAVGIERELTSLYKPIFPSVTAHVGTEVSLLDPHLGWYGGDIRLADYTGMSIDSHEDLAFQKARVDDIHAGGGLASYNHPFGSGGIALRSPADQEKKRAAVTAELLQNRAIGVDFIEAGYRLRAGLSLQQHLALWDAMSRNQIFLTGLGTSDDHHGVKWAELPNRFLTMAWAPSALEADLLAAMRAGQVYVAELGGFAGTLDLRVDGAWPMGSVSVSTAATRTLTVMATGLPAGGTLEVVRGPVDLAGPGVPAPGTSVLTTIPAADLTTGSAVVTVPNASPSFVRVAVRDAGGVQLAFSNPVWLLRSEPVWPVSPARRQPVA